MHSSIIATFSALALGLVAGSPPAWGASQADGDDFTNFSIEAQSQAASTYMYAAGDEVERLAGAVAKVDKPENVNVIAAAVQMGLVAGYSYGSTLGGSKSAGSGGTGLLPNTPPGEADALSPGDQKEATYKGPITTGAQGAVVDGEAHAKATSTPSGAAEFAFQQIDVPGQFHTANGASVSRGGPVAGGVVGESSSVLRDITIASVVNIRSLFSRVNAMFPTKAGAAPTGDGMTVVDGATVGGAPVEITSAGLRLSDQNLGGDQKAQLSQQVSSALASAHIENIRVVDATTSRTKSGALVVDAGRLLVTYRDTDLAAANPQGFGGGGFSLGGATVTLNAQRAGDITSPAGPARDTANSNRVAAATQPKAVAERRGALPASGTK
jgi:hypothetical protein